MKKIVIFGNGKMADVVFYNLKQAENLEIAAFTLDKQYISADTKFSLPVIPFENITEKYPPEQFSMFIAIGYQDMNKLREEKYNQAKSLGYELISYISPKADNIAVIKTGDNCLILGNSTIEPCCKIGNNNFIWSNSLIGHHSEIRDNCFISGGVTIGGSSVIENNCFIGLNSVIGHEINIGPENFIGAASLILKTTGEKSVFINPPTEKFRLNTDSFLKISKLK